MDGVLLSTTEAGLILGLSRHRVRRLVVYGVLPSTRVGRKYLIPKDAVDRLWASAQAPGLGGDRALDDGEIERLGRERLDSPRRSDLDADSGRVEPTSRPALPRRDDDRRDEVPEKCCALRLRDREPPFADLGLVF